MKKSGMHFATAIYIYLLRTQAFLRFWHELTVQDHMTIEEFSRSNTLQELIASMLVEKCAFQIWSLRSILSWMVDRQLRPKCQKKKKKKKNIKFSQGCEKLMS